MIWPGISYYCWQNIRNKIVPAFNHRKNLQRCWSSVLLKIWEMTVTFASVTRSEPRPCPHMLRSSPPAPAKYCDNLTGAGGWGPGIYIIIIITIHRRVCFISPQVFLPKGNAFLKDYLKAFFFIKRMRALEQRATVDICGYCLLFTLAIILNRAR